MKRVINFVPKLVRRLSVCPSVRLTVTILVNVYPPKLLDVATSNLVHG